MTLMAALTSASGCASKGGARNPCGLITSGNDPFDGPVRSFVQHLDKGRYTAISIKEAKGVYTLTLLMVQRGDSLSIGTVGEKAAFIIGGELLTLELQKEARPIVNVAMGNVFSQWALEFGVTREQVAQFGAAPLTAMKMAIGGQLFQLQLQEPLNTRIQNSARCMAQ